MVPMSLLNGRFAYLSLHCDIQLTACCGICDVSTWVGMTMHVLFQCLLLNGLLFILLNFTLIKFQGNIFVNWMFSLINIF